MIFPATIRSGKLYLDKADQFKKFLATFSDEKRVEVTVEKITRRRTTSQNAYLWGVVYKLIAQSTGHSEDELHAAFKYLYSPKAIVGSLVVPKSTRTHDTIEMTDYIEKIRQFAAETLSLNIPDPDEVVRDS